MNEALGRTIHDNSIPEVPESASAEIMSDYLKDWKITPGTYKAATIEAQRQRVASIEGQNPTGLWPLELTMYTLELAGKIKPREELEVLIDEIARGELDDKAAKKASRALQIARLAQHRAEEATRLAAGYEYQELTRVRELTKDFTASNTAVLEALTKLYDRDLISATIFRATEAVIRVMIAKQKGSDADLPESTPTVKVVQL